MLPSIVLLLFINCYNLIQGSLLDYPIKPIKGSVSIFSTLIDQSTQNTWTVKETLIVSPEQLTSKVHGKIEIIQGNNRIEVFYNGNEDKNRLVIHDNKCYEVKLTSNDWSSIIPTVKSSLVNLALLAGPSVYYRFLDRGDNFAYEPTVNLKGEKCSSVFTRVGFNLYLSYIFPVELKEADGIKQPRRLKLVTALQNSERLFYDINYEKKLSSTLDKSLVTPTLGIGCSRYLELNKPFPKLRSKKYHVNFIETIKTDQTIKSIYNQLSVDLRNKITRVTRIDQLESKQLEKAIYVFNLGIKYILSDDGKCHIEPLTTNDDSSIDENLIKIDPITLDIRDFKYVGQVSYEHRLGLIDVWESTEYNVTIGTNIYDKIVTSQFMALQFNDTDNLDSNYLPISAERKFYKLDSDNYILIESRKRDFYDYGLINHDDYRQLFQITDCYDSPDDKIYLTLQIAATDSNYEESFNYVGENMNNLRDTINQIIAYNFKLSYLRITKIDIEIESIYIYIHVEIIEAPYILDALDKVEYKFDHQSFDNYFIVSVKDPIDCLKALSKTSNIRYVISCFGMDGMCVGVKEDQLVPKSNPSGSYCTVYDNQNDKLRKLVDEVTLEQLGKKFNDLSGIKFSLSSSDHQNKFRFIINNVYQDSPSIDGQETRLLYMDIENGVKLNVINGESVTGVKNFGDCYRACALSKGTTCETFSFCSSLDGKNSVDCVVSEMNYASLLENGTIIDNSCNVYGKNNLLDYQKMSKVKFLEKPKTKLQIRTADECARACVNSETDCYSFQICDSRYCSFAGHYSPSVTTQDYFCDIYIPKKIQNFAKNSHQIITEPIFVSEVDLTLDQCASMCFSMRHKDNPKEFCQSFNFCPEGEANSICQLSSQTISLLASSTKTNSQVKTSDDCSNYQYFETIKQLEQDNTRSSVKHHYLNIGFMTIFSIIGFTMGLVTPWVHNYLKKKYSHYNDDDQLSTSSKTHSDYHVTSEI